MILNWELGRSAIDEGLPQGHNPRDGESYQALEAEIAKLVDIHAETGPDWQEVAQRASHVLQKEGKDLAVACWLLMAWVHTQQTQGLAAGVQMLRDLHENYWETMWPAVQRLRGRRNQLEWLLEALEKQLHINEGNWNALTEQEHAILLENWEALEAWWQEHDEQAPALFKLQRALKNLPVQGVQSQSDAASNSEANDKPTEPPKDIIANTEIEASISESHLATPVHPSSLAPPSTPTTIPEHPEQSQALSDDSSGFESLADITTYIEQGLEQLQKPLSALPDELLYIPLPYRFVRQCAWLTLDTLPHHTDGVSRIPAPAGADQNALQTLVDAGDALAILRFTEARLLNYRFWLDLNYYAFKAAQSLPQAHSVAQVIQQETAYFVARLPELLTMSFVNEQAFASNETRQWLRKEAESRVEVSKQAGKINSDADSASALGAATTFAVAGAETEAALRLLEVVAQRLQTAVNQYS